MIIDAHCHLAYEKWQPDKWWKSIAKLAACKFKQHGIDNFDEEEFLTEILPEMFFDPSGEKQLQIMEDAGIDMAVLTPLDYGVALGDAKVSIQEVNCEFAKLQKKYPDKFICFASIDPRRPKSQDLIKQALDEWGMRGVKFHPGAGFYPNSKEAYALLEIIAQRDVPVLFHTGHMVQPLYSKYCDPIWIDEVCSDFPDLKIVAAHMGHGYYAQLFSMGECKINLLTDISGWQKKAVHNYNDFCKILRCAIDSFGDNRIMFGSDGPFLRAVTADKNYIQIIRNMVNNDNSQIKFTKKEIDNILGDNAAELLGVSES